MRQYGNLDPPMSKPACKVELTIAMELEQFSEKEQRWLQHAIAGFLEIPPQAVRIASIERGSVKVTIELPRQDANRLLSAYRNKDPELGKHINPMVLLSLRQKMAGLEPMRQLKLLIQQLESYGCPELAANLRLGMRIGLQFEPAGSLDGYHLSNPFARAVNALITGGLDGCGMEVAHRTVDITFKAVGVEVSQAERDQFASLLNTGLLDASPEEYCEHSHPPKSTGAQTLDEVSAKETPRWDYLIRLRQLLATRFDEEELRTLCFDLGIDYCDLPTEGKANQARELIAYLEHHNRISELIGIVKRLRPDVSWSDTPIQANAEDEGTDGYVLPG
jgi:hypothetical protein